MLTKTQPVDLVNSLIGQLNEAGKNAKLAAEKAVREEFARRNEGKTLYAVFLDPKDERFKRGVFTSYEEALDELTCAEVIRNVPANRQWKAREAIDQLAETAPTEGRPVVIDFLGDKRLVYSVELVSPADVMKWVDLELHERRKYTSGYFCDCGEL